MHIQSASQDDKCLQGRVPFTPLKPADVSPVQSHVAGEVLLRIGDSGPAQVSQVLAEGLPVADRDCVPRLIIHVYEAIRMWIISQRIMSIMVVCITCLAVGDSPASTRVENPSETPQG